MFRAPLCVVVGLALAQGPTPARIESLIDFSHAGYEGGGVAIPEVPAALIVDPAEGDDGARIQAAIEIVGRMPRRADGFRGAVVLTAGSFDVAGTIRLSASGVIVRGSGTGSAGTTIVATGTSRRALIEVGGRGDRAISGARHAVLDSHVPAGSRTLAVANVSAFHVGDRVIVIRPSTKGWITRLGMDTFEGWRPETRLHWQPGSRDISWDRRITSVDGDRLSFDAPLTTALDAADGAGSVARYEFPGRVDDVGVENLHLDSAFDDTRPGDEDHAWTAVSLDRVENAWLRQISIRHFAGTAVDVRPLARAISIEDIDVSDPVSEDANFRRRAVSVSGELTLVQRCSSRAGRNDFVTGFGAAGPNVFLGCHTMGSTGFSGATESWASGVLFDNVRVRGNAISLGNRGTDNQGAGWAAANSVLWNCEATDVDVSSPPDSPNRAFGCKGTLTGDGIVVDERAVPFRDFFRGIPVTPESLYRSQLEKRLGRAALTAIDARPVLAEIGHAPHLSAVDVADSIARSRSSTTEAPRQPPLTIADGHFAIGSARAWTSRVSYSWFQGQMVPSLAPSFGPAITRFAPGRDGVGLTDDLEAVVSSMKIGGVFYQHYGLWYDRRRVNHNYDGSAERRTADVWAPFMEVPWARSGRGKAWDGLSRYDLTRFNPWYFDRIKTFADLCDRNGRVLYYNFYFQHWLLESRAHYVDFPWRPVNAIQDTGLADDVPAANAFWDLGSPVRRDLHRRYIRKVLDTLGEHTNVVFGLDPEYTGSVEFVRFWLDEIGAWQREHRRNVLVALSVPKDQMDSVLEDPARRRLIAAIDFHGWVYRPDGRLFAARGGLNRSLREQRADIASDDEKDALARRLDPALLVNPDFQNGPEFQSLFDTLWNSTPRLKAQAVEEYRRRYPMLVVLPGEFSQ